MSANPKTQREKVARAQLAVLRARGERALLAEQAVSRSARHRGEQSSRLGPTMARSARRPASHRREQSSQSNQWLAPLAAPYGKQSSPNHHRSLRSRTCAGAKGRWSGGPARKRRVFGNCRAGSKAAGGRARRRMTWQSSSVVGSEAIESNARERPAVWHDGGSSSDGGNGAGKQRTADIPEVVDTRHLLRAVIGTPHARWPTWRAEFLLLTTLISSDRALLFRTTRHEFPRPRDTDATSR